MGNLHYHKNICDKRFILAFFIALFCSIICGIVLYKPVTANEYFADFAYEYVYNVFTFNNGPLLLTHILSDLIYLYVFFFVCYFTKFKYLTLILIFLRGLFFGVYTAILIGVNSFGGIIVTFFVFVPATLISLALCLIVSETCKKINKKYALFMPAVLAVADLIIYALLINVLFRIIIIIV